jgi:ADP-heptose:LPS heptosyltransferase
VLDKLKQALSGRKKAKPFCLPGMLDDSCRILALASDDISDMLFHMPILVGIRKKWPGASLDFLVPESFSSLVIPSGLARQVLVYGEKQLASWRPSFRSLQRALGEARYDVSLVLSRSANPPLESLGLASGAVLRYGPSHAGAWPAVNFEFRIRPSSSSYAADSIMELAPFLGLDAEGLASGWPLPLDKLRQVAQVVHFNKPRPAEYLIGIDPGPDKSGRALSSQNLVFLVQQLRSWFDCRILPLCGPGGRERMRQFEAQLDAPVPPAFNRDTMLDAILLLNQCNLFLAGNTDLFHMAVAAGVPSVGLFGEQVGSSWHPRSGRRCVLFPVSAGKKIDPASLRSAVQAVIERPDDPGQTFDGSGFVGHPMPSPGT